MNKARKGGVCVTHGANTKRCSHEGCTNVTNDINIKGDNVVTNEGCEGVNNDDIMNLNIIHITSIEGGREVNLRILSL
jgi:hypothetical protein